MESRIGIPVSDGTTMNAFVARPKNDGPHPGIIVLQEAFGVNDYLRSVARRFADEGYIAVAPELFHRTAPGFEGNYSDFESVRPLMAAMTPEGIAADLQATYAWLRSDSQLQDDKIACIGFCMGGRASFLMNALAPVKAAISFYGSGIAPGNLDKAASLHAPMLFFWGGRDKNIPPEQIAQVTQTLTTHSKPFVNVVFSEAGHGFFCDVRPSFNPDAAAQAWALCLAFLRSHLK